MNDITDTTNDPNNEWLENYPYDSIVVGQAARLVRTLTLADIQAFAAVSGDTNPAHLDPEYANATLFHGVIGHGAYPYNLQRNVALAPFAPWAVGNGRPAPPPPTLRHAHPGAPRGGHGGPHVLPGALPAQGPV
jgi:hypothetical protein